MRYLITGGAGFIGSHLAEYLVENGDVVHVIDNFSTGRLSNIEHLRGKDNFSYSVASIMDYHALESLIENTDCIFHLAAAVGVKLIMENPVETIETNIRGTENVLKLASYHDKKVLIASTSEVYGKLMENEDEMSALKEDGDWRLGPTSKRRWAYACSKAMDEFHALAYYDEKKLPVVIARFFNTVGPRQTGRYGMVVPNFVQKALMNEPIHIYGDGEQTRCFTHVHDVVEAVYNLMHNPDAEGEVFNIGGEEEISINQLAHKVKDMTNSESKLVHIPYEEVYGKGFEDMRKRTPDLSKIKSYIGYETKSGLEDILESVIQYFKGEDVLY